jgi:nucleoside phosphorylase
VKSVVFGKETDRRLSHGSSNPNSDDEDGHQPYTFAVPGGEREAAPTMNHHGKASSVSFPVERGTGSSLSRRETFTSMTPSVASRPKREDYKVGWICAVQIEHVIVLEILDEEFQAPLDIPARDDNLYSFGRIADHNIVVGCLPQGKYGTASAASVAVNMLRSFERIRIGLLVGIGGGAPSKKHDIRLGDVVVSSPAGQNGGIFHYEFGKAIQDKTFEHTGLMASPPSILLSAMQVLGTSHVRRGHKISSTINALLEKNERLVDQYKKPNASSDVLFQSSLTHPEGNENCEWCIQNTDKIVDRKQRNPKADDPVVHYGLIASADHLMKDANTRDLLVKEKDVLCFEMEAAGLDRFPCVVIRGICDYSDTHKNDIWQGYAAATAAAYAKELLQVIPPHQVRQAEAAAGAYFMQHSPELHSESLGPVDLNNLSSLENA